jgi:hypothetical protein
MGALTDVLFPVAADAGAGNQGATDPEAGLESGNVIREMLGAVETKAMEIFAGTETGQALTRQYATTVAQQKANQAGAWLKENAEVLALGVGVIALLMVGSRGVRR